MKWRLFRHLATGRDPDAERVYRWHILARTGGVERGSWKRTTDDYVRAARELWASFRHRGYDPAYPIPIGSNGLQMGGAHRLAAALAFEVDVWTVRLDTPGRARPWDLAWFHGMGAPYPDIARMLADWEAMKQCRVPA